MAAHTNRNLKTQERMTEAIRFIDSFATENGYSPSIREIGEAMGVPSTSTVAEMMAEISAKGYIEQPKDGKRLARALKISKEGRALLG